MKKALHTLLLSALALATMESATLAQGVLTGSVAPDSGLNVNLTAEGTTDWSHWGLGGVKQDHKAVGGNAVGLISDQTLANATGNGAYGDNFLGYTWTDGTPVASTSNSTTGIYEANGSFTFTVPAGTTSQTLKVYVGGVTAGAGFSASLSDGSAPDYKDGDPSYNTPVTGTLNSAAAAFAPDGNHFNGVYTITFKAASAGQTLTITYGQTAGSGNVTLQAATLYLTPTAPPAAPANLVAIAGTGRVGLTFSSAATATGYNVKRSLSASGPFTTIATGITGTSYQDNGLTNGTTYYYQVTALNAIGESAASNVASATPQVGLDGTGITGKYYTTGANVGNSPFNFATNTPTVTEVDPTINFNVDTARPAGVPHDNISIMWTGAVKAPVTGGYVFTTAADDGIRLYVDGALVIDNYVYQGTTTRNSPTINFTAGSFHTVRVLYFQGGGGGVAQLSWSYPGQTTQIIPTVSLFPDASLFAPAAPTLAGVPASGSSINLIYNVPDNATSVTILRSLTAGGPYTTLATGVTAANYTDTGLTAGTTYYYVVQAVSSKGTSANSNEVAVAPVPPVIGNGNGLAGTYYASGAFNFSGETTTPIYYNVVPTVNFNYNNGGVSYNPGPFPSALPLTNLTAVWTGQVLAPYTGSYQFQTITDDAARLTIDTDTATGVVLFDDENGHGPLANTGAAVNLTAGKKYNIKFEFVQGGGGETAQLLYNPLGSGFVIIPQTQLYPNFAAAPAAPTNLTAIGSDTLVTLNFSPSPTAITYNVLRSTTAGGPFTTIATGVNVNTYNDTTVTNGTTYYYEVIAVNNVGPSAASNVASATPVAAVIGNGNGLLGTYYNGGAVDFSAEATTPILTLITPTVNYNANGNTTGYNPVNFPAGVPATQFTAVYSGQFLAPYTGSYQFQTITDDGARLTVNSVVQFDDETGHGPLANTGAAINLVAGQKYDIKFEYVQGTGGDTAQLLYSPLGLPFQIIPQSQLFTVFTTAPTAPTNLTASGNNNSITLTYTSVANAGSYTILRSLTAGGPYTTVATNVISATYTDTTVTNGTKYYYVVRAVNNIGTSANSNEASATPFLGRILAYNFENGPSGVNPDPITDITGNNNTGFAISPDVAGSDAAFVHDAASGVWAGQSVDGAHYLALPTSLNLGNQFTFFTFVKLASDRASGNIQPIFANSRSGGASSGISFYVNDYNNPDSHDLVVETNTGTTNGANVQTKATSPLGTFQFDGKYHAVAMVVDRTAGQVSIYYDGQKVLSNAPIDTQWSTMTGDNRLGEFANGDIVSPNAEFDNVALYNVKLSDADIAALGSTGATVTGTVSLEGVSDLSALSPSAPLGKFHVVFRNTATSVETAYDVTLATTAGSANGTFTVSGIPAGTYNVIVKGAKNLAVLVPNVVVSATSGTVGSAANPVILPAGDSNNDNSVDSSDFGTLIGAFNTDGSVAGSGYDPAVDFNFDGLVDSSDFGLLIGEFNNTGAI